MPLIILLTSRGKWYKWLQGQKSNSDLLKGVCSGHKSVTSILPNNPTMLPLFSLFMNFPPIMSGSHSGLIIGFELPPH